jgi:hypothetical protein
MNIIFRADSRTPGEALGLDLGDEVIIAAPAER